MINSSSVFVEVVKWHKPLHALVRDAIQGNITAALVIVFTARRWHDELPQETKTKATISKIIYDGEIYEALVQNSHALQSSLQCDSWRQGGEFEFDICRFLEWSTRIRSLEEEIANQSIWAHGSMAFEELEKLLSDMSQGGKSTIYDETYQKHFKWIQDFLKETRNGEKPTRLDWGEIPLGQSQALKAVDELLETLSSRSAASILSSPQKKNWIGKIRDTIQSQAFQQSHESRILGILILKVWLIED